jgi:SP family general alpha glucoside:H+ symporter-like MFS transporter
MALSLPETDYSFSVSSFLILTCFSSTQANSLGVLTAGQFLEGIPWGFFIANSPAYASEIVPLALRGATTATLQMSWSIGQIIVSAVTYSYNKRDDEWAWRAPLALQWLFPVRYRIALHSVYLMRLIQSRRPS